METLFQVDAQVAERFATLVSERKKGGVRITPALNQTEQNYQRLPLPQGNAEAAPASAP